MKAIYQNGTAAPCPSSFNLAGYVLQAGHLSPEKTALAVLSMSGARRIRYAELQQSVLGVATGLLATGAIPGDRVLLRLGNTPEFPIAFLGAIAAGLVPVPTSSQLTQSEVDAVAAQIEPAIILASDGVTVPTQSGATVLPVQTLNEMHENPPARIAQTQADDPAYIVFTSGTSGAPRAVVHAHRAVWARRMMWDGWYGLQASDRLLHAGAFNWTYTLGTGILDPWAIGATALIPAPGITADHLPLLLKRHDATIFAAAPGVYRQILKHDVPPLPKLRHGLSAGEKLPDSTRKDWRRATGCEVYEAFGMSECSTFISSAPPNPVTGHSLGRPQPGRHVAIIDAGEAVEIGDEGTIAIHKDDPGLMLGYLGHPEETAAKYDGPWFLTGDRGAMDADGMVTYLGRADDMMNAGGFRVSPLEVEAAFGNCPGITDCAAIEMEVRPDVRVVALYFSATEPLDEADLKNWGADKLARYKQPRVFCQIDAMPRSANGKLLRKSLPRRPAD